MKNKFIITIGIFITMIGIASGTVTSDTIPSFVGTVILIVSVFIFMNQQEKNNENSTNI